VKNSLDIKHESGYTDELLKAGDDFKANFWELAIEGHSYAKYRIESTSLPFTTFTTESHPNGERYFSDYELPGEFSISIREAKNLDILEFFEKWEKGFFKDGCFIAQPSNVELGSEQDKVHRRVTLNLIGHKTEKTSNLTSKVYEITDNAVSGKLKTLGARLQNLTHVFGEKSPEFLKTSTRTTEVKRGLSNQSKEIILKSYSYELVKYLGIEPVSFDYSSGDPLVYSVSFAFDSIEKSN